MNFMYIKLHVLETGNYVSVCLGLKRRVIGLLPVYTSVFFFLFKSITIAPNFKSNYLKGFKRALVHLAWKTNTSAKALLALYIITVHGFWRDDCPHSHVFLAKYLLITQYTCITTAWVCSTKVQRLNQRACSRVLWPTEKCESLHYKTKNMTEKSLQTAAEILYQGSKALCFHNHTLGFMLTQC